MVLVYIIIVFVIILFNIGEVLCIIVMIVGDVFLLMAGVGVVIGWGVKCGVYFNEVG